MPPGQCGLLASPVTQPDFRDALIDIHRPGEAVIGTVKQHPGRLIGHKNGQKMARRNGGPSFRSKIVFALLARDFELLQLFINAIANLEKKIAKRFVFLHQFLFSHGFSIHNGLTTIPTAFCEIGSA